MRHKTTPPLVFSSGAILMCAMLLASHSTVAAGAARPASSQSQSPSKISIPHLAQEKKRIVTWRRKETDRGPIITLTSDAALNDYTSYVDGERFFVRIPQASLASARSNLGDHGAADMLVEEGHEDVVISVKILQGSTVRVSQSFNRLELIVLIHDRVKG